VPFVQLNGTARWCPESVFEAILIYAIFLAGEKVVKFFPAQNRRQNEGILKQQTTSSKNGREEP